MKMKNCPSASTINYNRASKEVEGPISARKEGLK
jgi:hypothetical protein